MSDQTITSLIEKLEGASEGSVELSCDIGIALGEWTPPKDAERDIYSPDIWRRNGLKYYQPYAEVTTSLDAALALAERVLTLGAWDVGYYYNSDRPHYARLVIVRDDEGQPEIYGRSATPALALCAAILRAQSEARV